MELKKDNHRYLKSLTKVVSLKQGIRIGRKLHNFLDELSKKQGQLVAYGLAANQVGINARVFIAWNPNEYFDTGYKKERESLGKDVYYFINPRIVGVSPYLGTAVAEGCLSLPGRIFKVKRYDSITVEYDTPKGPSRATFTGLMGRIVQHEMEHLNGLLLTGNPNAIELELR